MPAIIDHLGGPVAERGTSAPVMRMMLDLLRTKNWWWAFPNGDLRSQQGEPWDDMVAFGRMFYEAAPDRCMWEPTAARPSFHQHHGRALGGQDIAFEQITI